MEDLSEILGQRLSRSVAMLCDAVRLDAARFVGEQVDARLGQDHLLSRMTKAALVRLRERLDDQINLVVAATEEPIHALRASLEAPLAPEEAAAALGRVIGPLIVDAARKVLRACVDKTTPSPTPRQPAGGALEPAVTCAYVPSPILAWAFRQVCLLDAAARHVVDARGEPLLPTPELRRFLPEAMHPERARFRL